MTTKRKKVYKLKRWPKLLIVFLIILAIAIPFGYNKYQEYLYTLTQEYKLLELGYDGTETEIILNNLSESEIDTILSYEYNEFIPEFVGCKYFLFKNLDDYLSQVITQEEDFFKYHGTDGYDYDEIIALVNVHADGEAYEGDYQTNLEDGYGILVNKYYELGSSYVPDDLVSVPWKYRLGGENDVKEIRSEVYDAFLEMWESAMEMGIYLLVDSAYRSYESQQTVYTYYENLKGTKYADFIAARAGYSEHQTGLSLDIYSKECTSANTFKDSDTYDWLINNSYKYGFILRYPEGKSDITGYSYESWHYRYLGVELATKVYNEGITYDEYYAYYLDK